MGWLHWLMVHLSQETGTSNAASRAYDFWSGFGSDIGEITLVAGVAAYWRKHNCHQHRCWRLSRHPVGDGTFVVCRRHHPDIQGKKTTAADIAAAHEATAS